MMGETIPDTENDEDLVHGVLPVLYGTRDVEGGGGGGLIERE